MNYEDLIEQTKKALENYSKADAELEELYRQAKERNSKSYELSKQQLAEQYYEDKNQAAAKAKLDEKDMSAFLAARGLTSSGESIQTKIDSNMALSNTLSSLAKENMKALTELEKERLNKENELELSRAEKKLELNKQKNSLSDQIEQLKKALEANQQSNSGSKNNNKTTTGSGSSGKSGNQSQKDTTDNTFVPSTSAKDVAKNIVETYGTNGRITSDLQRGQIKKYLQSMLKNDGVDEDYIKNIIFNLKTYGYTDISDSYADAVLAAEDAFKYYDKLYNELFEVYIRGNRTSEKAGEMAKSKAKTMMLDYIYERSSTVAAFENTAKLAGVTQKELEEYYQRLNNIMSNGEKITLGSKIK